jgi:hypothetical protein
MSDLSVSGADFSGVASVDGTAMKLFLKGNGDYAALEPLDQLLTKVHAEALRTGAKTLECDLRQLEFMNSSCFKSFVSWINTIQELEPAQQYHVTFVSNPTLHWQKRSLHTLRCFAVELITVVEQ